MGKNKYRPKQKQPPQEKNSTNSNPQRHQPNQMSSLSFYSEPNPQKQSQREKSSQQENILENLSNSSNSSSQGFSDEDFQTKVYEKKLSYTMKQWLTLGLLKIVPPKSRDIQIDIKSNLIKGEKQTVQKFCDKMQKKNKQMVLKVLKFSIQIPLQEIEVQLQEQWNAKIFSFTLVNKMYQKLQETYKIGQPLRQQIEQIKSKYSQNLNLPRFLLIKQEFYKDQAYPKINDIFRKFKRMSQQQRPRIGNQGSVNQSRASLNRSQSNSSLQTSVIFPNGNQSKISKKKQQKRDKESEWDSYQNQNSHNNSSDNSVNYYALVDKHMKKTFKKQEKQQKQDHKQAQQKCQKKISQSTKNSQNNANKNLKEFQSLLDQSNISMISPNDISHDKSYQNQQRQAPQRTQRRGNRRPTRPILFSCQYPSQYIDKNHLKKWIKGNRSLHVSDLQLQDKYSQEQNISYCLVNYYGQDPHDKKKYSLNLYFKFQRIIKLQDQQTRDAVIQKFVSNNAWMQIQHKVIYTKQRHPNDKRLRQLAKQDNTHKFKYQYSNVHHVLLLIGLMTLIDQTQQDINFFVKQLKEKSRKIIIELQFQEIKQFIRQQQVFNFIQQCIKQYFNENSKNVKLCKVQRIYNEISVQIQASNVPQKQQKSFKQNLKQKLQRLICKHEFQQDQYESSQKIFDDLKAKYFLIQNEKKGITLISKEKQSKKILKQIQKQLKNAQKPIDYQYQIRQKSQFTLSKQFLEKKNKELFNSKIIIRYEENQNSKKIIFYGPQFYVNRIVESLKDYLQILAGKIYKYHFNLSQEQLQIIRNDKQLHSTVQNQWKINLKQQNNMKIGAIVKVKTIQPDNSSNYPIKILNFQYQQNFSTFDQNSIIIFRTVQQIDSIKKPFVAPLKNKIKNFTKYANYDDTVKKFRLFYQNLGSHLKITQIIQQNIKDYKKIYLFVSQNVPGFDKYLRLVIQLIGMSQVLKNQQISVTFIGSKTTNFKNLLKYDQGRKILYRLVDTKWYTKQGVQKFYYSNSGNQKIQSAIKNGLSSVELVNQDLNLTIKTHSFQFQDKTMTHLKSGSTIPITIHKNKITFMLNGTERAIPDSQYKKIPSKSGLFNAEKTLIDCQLSIGFYKIDLKSNIQINLFSNYRRQIYQQQVDNKVTLKYELQAQYDVKTNRLTLQYTDECRNSIHPTINYVKQFLKNKIVRVQNKFEGQITVQLVQQFRNQAQQNNIQLQISEDKKSYVLTSYSKKNIQNHLKILQFSAKPFKNSKTQVQFPKEWVAQTNQIQTFQVISNTDQFKKVQAAFTLGKIVQLIRIQNKYIYKRFYDQKMFLKQMNDGVSVKQMLLYHGTRGTDPKQIYQDKEDGFNVNYTGQSNLLGRGIYFAERSQYSYNYSYNQPLGNGLLSMFYCNVLVGDSQKCLAHNGSIKDTDFKNSQKKIRYESMTDFLQGSNVFVVYKNKRAYPLYLIKYRK